ncbi:arginine-specific carbamoyl-phosphate synthetase, small chain [Conidiobolus coronatus NRRL 28638]|uniref:Carbamoyl phosphate synthase arginine-specific small chain n=1 Tax=Conidiobolus coronatus (strain ATCC 28846 / CBS 209.66 / NRRL 28638) TaxID=796925 RepID=A0A137PFT0_CONC2|nr:arginine-specific carbamoyl-phosphate synthetase, small chain [Conidiobolus coronatus NRRL 28638]|eukprot:KXN73854.1 arginine-specific carbamoyl-phosphate synthetase, small chain [Conidiobolus coronatus NRRL 28638]
MFASLSITRSLATVSDISNLQFSNFNQQNAYLKLKTGQVFSGTSFGAPIPKSGEAVFTTSTVGYPESLTDPSYRGQILVFTQPLIGNYGVPPQEQDIYKLLKYFESDKIQVQGIIVNDYATKYSHWNAVQSLSQWCVQQGVPAISGIDTRAVVHLLRNQGSTLGCIDFNLNSTPEFNDPNQRNLVDEVSTKEPYQVGLDGSDVHIGVIDCGIKHNILRSIISKGAKATVLPWNYDVAKNAHKFDGLFISNGPGNPTHCSPLVNNMKQVFETYNKPIFGICMGNQIIGMAAGLNIAKMQYGNRGHNQPAVHLESGKCYITSQNHGYALNDQNMPQSWSKYFQNANDGSNEGIKHNSLPISSVQFHPEAKGGPEDTLFLFDKFLANVRTHKFANSSILKGVRQQQKVHIPLENTTVNQSQLHA